MFGHSSEVKAFLKEELSEDVAHVVVLRIQSILQELHYVFPVLQSNVNLETRRKKYVVDRKILCISS